MKCTHGHVGVIVIQTDVPTPIQVVDSIHMAEKFIKPSKPLHDQPTTIHTYITNGIVPCAI